jgi:UDP:flavonoid glycosyltransferase YjiC (YdhE family)
VRLATYAFKDGELTSAIDHLLDDAGLRNRMTAIGTEIRARDGVARAADAIEAVGVRAAAAPAR